MGAVYLAHDLQLDRKVALKRLFADAHTSPAERRARLMLEAQAMAQLAHPNVVGVFDVGEDEGQLFVAMEFVAGATLSGWLKQARTQRAILDVFAQAGRGLAAAHGVGLVHRDFKPDNVLVGADGRVRVSDFGLARVQARPIDPQALLGLDVTGPTRPVAFTAPGAIVGTPLYMAPEQWRGEAVTPLTDQFAFGIALFEALYKKRPFAGNSVRELMANVLSGRVEPAPANAPTWQKAMFKRLLALAPNARYPSMEAVLGELLLDHGRASRRVGMLAAGVVGVALVAGLTRVTLSSAQAPVAAAMKNVGSSRAVPVEYPAGSVCARLSSGALRRPRDIWTEERKNKLGTKHLLAQDTNMAMRLRERFDAYSAAWELTMRSYCDTAPAATGANPSTFFACMGDQLRAFDGLLSTMDFVNTRDNGLSLELYYELLEPERCTVAEVLRWTPAPPTEASRGRAELAAANATRLIAQANLNNSLDELKLYEQLTRDLPTILDPVTRAYCAYALGAHARDRRAYEDSARHLIEAVETARGASDVEGEIRYATLLGEVLGIWLFRPDEANQWLRAAQDRGRDQPGLAELTATLNETHALVQRQAGYLKESVELISQAISLREKRLGAKHPLTARARITRGLLLIELEKREDALLDTAAALATSLETFGELSISAARAHEAHGTALFENNQLDLARQELEQSINVYKKFVGAGRPIYANAMDVLGRLSLATGDVDEAEKLFEKTERSRRLGILIDPPDHAASLFGLALVARARNDFAKAADFDNQAVTAVEKAFGENDPRIIPYLLEQATDLEAAKNGTKAFECLIRAAKSVATLGDDSPLFARIGLASARQLLEAGNAAEALKDLEEANRRLSIGYPSYHPLSAEVSIMRAKASLALGDPARAKELYGVAIFGLEEHYGKDHPRVKEVTDELASLKLP